MRYLFASLAFTLTLFSGCSDTAGEVARREIARTTALVQSTDAGHKQMVANLLDVVVADERAKRAAELAAVPGCAGYDPTKTPAPACDAVWQAALARYQARVADLKARATRVDAAVGLAYATLLAAVTAVAQAESGASWGDWPGLLKRLTEIVAALKAVYDEFKGFYVAAGGTPPQWVP